MTMTRLPMGCNGGMVGVSAPLTSNMTAQDVTRENALAGGGKATVVLSPAVDAMAYTPAATLTGANDVEDGHHIQPSEDNSRTGDIAARSAQENWSAGRLNPFGKLWDMMSPMRGWLAELVMPKSLESGLVLAGAQAYDLSVPTVSMMALAEETSGRPNVTSSKPDRGPSSSQVDDKKKVPTQARQYGEVPRWKVVLAMTAGRR